MKKLTEENFKITNHTSHNLRLRLFCELDKIIKVFGKPTTIGSIDYKIQLEWVFYKKENSDYKTITIYDYKEKQNINNIVRWEIGSKNLTKDEVLEFFKSQKIILPIYEQKIDGLNIYHEKLL